MKVDLDSVNLELARKCLTTSELAEASGLTLQGLNNIIKGKRATKPATLGKIARALGVDPVEIVKD